MDRKLSDTWEKTITKRKQDITKAKSKTMTSQPQICTYVPLLMRWGFHCGNAILSHRVCWYFYLSLDDRLHIVLIHVHGWVYDSWRSIKCEQATVQSKSHHRKIKHHCRNKNGRHCYYHLRFLHISSLSWLPIIYSVRFSLKHYRQTIITYI